MAWFDRDGRKLGLVGAPADYSDLSLAPGDKSLTFTQADSDTGNVDIWVMDLANSTPSRFTFENAVDFGLVWSPDGQQIVFASLREVAPNLFKKMANGSGQEDPLTGRHWQNFLLIGPEMDVTSFAPQLIRKQV